MRTDYLLTTVSIALLATASAANAVTLAQPRDDAPVAAAAVRSLYIVQAPTLSASQHSVEWVNASVDRNLEIIHAVSAYLTATQVQRLAADSSVHLFQDRTLSTSGVSSLLGSLTKSVVSAIAPAVAPVVTAVTPLVTPLARALTPVTNPVLALATPVASPLVTPLLAPVVSSLSSSQQLKDGTGVGSSSLLYETDYPMLVGADSLHQGGITGKGVTIAVLDSGLWQDPSQNFGPRLLASIDVVNGGSGPVKGDAYGHGTHVTSIAAGGAQDISLSYSGIAPRPTWSKCARSMAPAAAATPTSSPD